MPSENDVPSGELEMRKDAGALEDARHRKAERAAALLEPLMARCLDEQAATQEVLLGEAEALEVQALVVRDTQVSFVLHLSRVSTRTRLPPTLSSSARTRASAMNE